MPVRALLFVDAQFLSGLLANLVRVTPYNLI